MILYVALRHTAEGMGLTRPPMLIAGSVLPLNALLNYALVYGNWGHQNLVALAVAGQRQSFSGLNLV